MSVILLHLQNEINDEDDIEIKKFDSESQAKLFMREEVEKAYLRDRKQYSRNNYKECRVITDIRASYIYNYTLDEDEEYFPNIISKGETWLIVN